MSCLSTKGTFSIALADSNQMLGEGLKAILTDLSNEFLFVDQQRDLGTLKSNFKNYEPQIVLAELFSDDTYEVSDLKKFTTEHPEIKVLIYSVSAEKEHVLEALKNGAIGYLLKRTEIDEVLYALRTISQDHYYIDPQIAPFLIHEVRRLNDTFNSSELFSVQLSDPSPELLTKKEMDIVRLLTRGRSNRAIGEALNIKEKNVKNYVSSILSKLGATDRTQIVLKAIKNGWVEL